MIFATMSVNAASPFSTFLPSTEAPWYWVPFGFMKAKKFWASDGHDRPARWTTPPNLQ